jgi:HK97 family phage portal protein
MVRDSVTTRPVEYRIIKPGDVSDIVQENGMLFYFVTGFNDPIPAYDIIHLTAMGQLLTPTGGWKARSPIQLHAETIGAAKMRNTAQAAVMRNGGFMSGIVKSPTALKPEQKEAIRQSFNTKHSGAANAGTTAILEFGLDYQQLTINPADLQMIEAMSFSVEDIARIYGIPPHMIGHLERSTNNNIEHQAIEYVQYCLLPWAIMMEQAFDGRIFRIAERAEMRFYTKLELNALMRGDVNARKEYYQTMLDRGVFSINEVRALEDMNEIPGGDMRLVQGNMITIENMQNGNPQD